MTNKVTKVKIDKGIVMPRVRSDLNGLPFNEMEVGDSFLFPPEFRVNQAGYLIYNAHRQLPNGKKFCRRITDEGIRCWRIK